MVPTKPSFTALQRQRTSDCTDNKYKSVIESIDKIVGVIGTFSISLAAQ